jgi:hypothetical protein
MTDLNRRDFLKQVAIAGAGIQAGLLCPGFAKELRIPKMSIAKYRTSPAEPEGVAEEAVILTRKAIEALGGMSRFVSKGQVVWVKPNIAWDRTPEQAGNTNPDVVATVIKMCYEAGAKEVMVGDNPCNAGERTYPNFARELLPVSGSENVSSYLFNGIEKDLGGRWAVESDPVKAAKMILEHIESKRDALGINVKKERKLYDMEDRRSLAVQ